MLIVGLAVALAGCGYNPNKPVYDTADNPDNFPAPALELLEAIENGQMTTLTDITSSFGNLYTLHSELLDNDNWRQIIDRLGSKFRYMADTLTNRGLDGYYRAAEFYELASFARPGDKQIRRRAALFAAWHRAGDDPLIDLASITGQNKIDPNAILTLTRYFMLADTLSQSFFADYLAAPLRAKLASLSPDTLAVADRLLAAKAGLADTPAVEPIASFGEPAIDLLALRLERIDSGRVIAEAYLIPRESVPCELAVILQLNSDDPALSEMTENLQSTTCDLQPVSPSETWQPGQVTLVSRRFQYPGTPSTISVGIRDNGSSPARYLMSADGERTFVPLDIPIMPAR